MKLVSKKWQEIRVNQELIEKYEYLSLRDREAYSILRDFHNNLKSTEAGAPDTAIFLNGSKSQKTRGVQIE